MKYSRGDIVLANLPYSDRSSSKVRPALVVQNDLNNSRLDDVILAMITSTTSRAVAEPISRPRAPPRAVGSRLEDARVPRRPAEAADGDRRRGPGRDPHARRGKRGGDAGVPVPRHARPEERVAHARRRIQVGRQEEKGRLKGS